MQQRCETFGYRHSIRKAQAGLATARRAAPLALRLQPLWRIRKTHRGYGLRAPTRAGSEQGNCSRRGGDCTDCVARLRAVSCGSSLLIFCAPLRLNTCDKAITVKATYDGGHRYRVGTDTRGYRSADYDAVMETLGVAAS